MLPYKYALHLIFKCIILVFTFALAFRYLMVIYLGLDLGYINKGLNGYIVIRPLKAK
jgi:hypothetical protein